MSNSTTTPPVPRHKLEAALAAVAGGTSLRDAAEQGGAHRRAKAAPAVLATVAAHGPATTARVAALAHVDQDVARGALVLLETRGQVARSRGRGPVADTWDVTATGREEAGGAPAPAAPPSGTRIKVIQGHMIPCRAWEAARREDCRRYVDCLTAHVRGLRHAETKQLEHARCPDDSDDGCRWYAEDRMRAVEFMRTGLSAGANADTVPGHDQCYWWRQADQLTAHHQARQEYRFGGDHAAAVRVETLAELAHMVRPAPAWYEETRTQCEL